MLSGVSTGGEVANRNCQYTAQQTLPNEIKN
jgi:hypothetical protein